MAQSGWRVDYHEYIQSDEWRGKRKERLIFAGYCCELCNISYKLEVHHRTYERLGDEELGDLFVLCVDCHQLFHSRMEVVPTNKHPEYWSVYIARRAGLIVERRDTDD